MHECLSSRNILECCETADVIRVRVCQHNIANVARLFADLFDCVQDLGYASRQARIENQSAAIRSHNTSRNVFTGRTEIAYSPSTIYVALPPNASRHASASRASHREISPDVCCTFTEKAQNY